MSASTLTSPREESPAGRAAETFNADSLSILAQLCARAQPPDAVAQQVRALARSNPDWDALLSAAADHGIAPLFCQRLADQPAGALTENELPEKWQQRFRQEFILNTHRNLLLTAELIRVLNALERAGVQAIPFKGPVLAQQAYGDLALRQFADLDIVLRHSQIAQAHSAMESIDYVSEGAASALAEGRIPGQYAYRSEERGALVELHTEKTMRYLPVPLDWKGLTPRLETVSLGGQSLRTFSREDTMMLLCVHGTKHFWTRLGWIGDIAELVQTQRSINWERAEKLARNMQCRRMWLLGLSLANEVLAAPLPQDIARQIRDDARVVALSRRVQTQYLQGGESSLSPADRLRFRVNSQDTLAIGLRQLSVFATRPTDEDWQSSSLPKWAAPLYAILRPLRILRDYALGPRR